MKSILLEALSQDPNARSLSYFFTTDVGAVSRQLIDALIEESRRRDFCNARVCLHSSPQAEFHDMIVLQYRGRIYPPHKHLTKSETCHSIIGEVAMVTFDDSGKVIESVTLDGKNNYLCRVGAQRWHAVIPLSDFAVYHESKPGPFLGADDSIFPSWAPDSSSDSAKEYMESLLKTLANGK